MFQTLEAVKGGGGSIKVGTTGTISALMSRELESTKYASQMVSSVPKRLGPIASADEASSSRSNKSNYHKNHEIVRKTKQHSRKTNQIPMLDSDNISLDGTPRRVKPDKKGSYMVEIVDIKCRNTDRAWAGPITNRLKKLGFSKLSESII